MLILNNGIMESNAGANSQIKSKRNECLLTRQTKNVTWEKVILAQNLRSERFVMNSAPVIFVIFLRFFNVENRMIPQKYVRHVVTVQEPESTESYPFYNFGMHTEAKSEDNDYEHEKVIGVKEVEKEQDDYSYDYDKKQLLQKLKEPCAIVVLSNIQSPTMQSLIRKYKYDETGALIPSSVKYYMKVPQGYGAPMLVPLNDKSYSHLGGFVRYYKEVPPIPQSW